MLHQLADDVWEVPHPLRFMGFAIGTRMTVIRLPSGGLLLHSPVPVDDRLAGELAEIGGTYLLMEEMVDALVIVLLARYSIYALRVRPQMSARSSLTLGWLTSCIFGFMKMAALGTR